MGKYGNKIITIFCDKENNYYVKEISNTKPTLPEGSELKKEHREILIGAFPNMTERIKDHIKGSGYVDDEILKMIRAYNESVKSGKVVKWYKACKNRLVKIDTEPTDIDAGNEYTDDQNLNDIISFIDELKKKSNHRIYATFVCPRCGKMQIQLVKNKKGVQCDGDVCNEYIDNIYDKKRIEKIVVFDSENSDLNKVNAYSILQQWKKGESSNLEQNVKGNSPFCFRENVYEVSYNDSKSLHKELYKSFAVQEVFDSTDRGVTFTEGYKNYIRSLGKHDINPTSHKEMTLWKEMVSIENRINSQENNYLPVEKAFYWYMNKYGLTDEKALKWRFDNKIASFGSASSFVQALLDADEKERKQLISIYKAVTDLDLDNSFFDGYDESNEIGLSYMIYDKTGSFVRITNDGQLVRFGDSLIDDLHKYDELISERNIFIEEIKEYGPFWEKIKGSFDDYADLYYESIDGTYYDRLCFYQYAIQGKREIKYKNITLPDSVQGFERIKDVVCRAYIKEYQKDIETYKCYAELLKNDVLWGSYDRFSKLRDANTINASGKEILNFNSLRESIINNPEAPTIDLYLRCVDASYKSIPRIEFWYNKKLNTLSGHIMALVEDARTETIVKEVSNFYKNPDVACVIDSFLNNTIMGGTSKFKEEQERAFSALVESSEKMKKSFDEQRKSIAEKEIRGIRRNEEEPKISAPQPSKPVNNISSNKDPVKKRRNDDDEWS